MEFLKSLFTKPLSYDEFVAAVTGAGIKLADLSGGEYVAKGKLTEMTDKNKALAEKVTSYEKTIGDLKASAGNTDALQSWKRPSQTETLPKRQHPKLPLSRGVSMPCRQTSRF